MSDVYVVAESDSISKYAQFEKKYGGLAMITLITVYMCLHDEKK